MRVYFDTEFTGLVPETTLISIGMVDETGAMFYAEFDDYRKDLCDDWIQKNVIDNLIFKRPSMSLDLNLSRKMISVSILEALKEAGIADYNCRNRFVKGNSNYISEELRTWLEEIPEQVQLVSDVCHYDMTLLCNLFGGAFNLPKNVNPVCYDICQDISLGMTGNKVSSFPPNAVAMNKAFDERREKLYLKFKGRLPSGAKHNSLYDAEIIKGILEGLWVVD